MSLKERIKKIINLFKFKIFFEKNLKKKGYTNFKTFQFENWHHDYCYFIAEKNNRKFFIKIDFNFKLLKNDYLAYNLANNDLKRYMVKVEDFFEVKGIGQLLILEFLESYKPLEISYLNKNKNIVHEIKNILMLLNKHSIIHRDIKLNNFLINKEGNIKIIDFTFCISNKWDFFKDLKLTYKNLEILENLGEKLNPEPFKWNDCFSFKTILKKYNFEQELSFFEHIECDTYEIVPPKFYFFFKKIKFNLKNFLKDVSG